MKHTVLKFAVAAIVTTSFAACTSMNRTMREPNSRVNFKKDDFTFSEQVSAEAKTIKILGIDWKRLFKKSAASVEGANAAINIASIPVIGGLVGDATANYALYELMTANPGYDVVFYPQFETTTKKPALGIGFFYKKTTVKTTARLGKLK